MDYENRPRKTYTPAQAKLKAESTCAYQERCQQEMRDKLYDWGLYGNDVEDVIAHLITVGFLNEERFSKAYAGGKFRIKKWGRVKIKNELRFRKISDYCIKQAMKEIDDEEYMITLKQVVAKKLKEVKGAKEYIRNYKVVKYAMTRGFESDLIWDVLKGR